MLMPTFLLLLSVGIFLLLIDYAMLRYLGLTKKPLTPYQEICAIKDRLYRDMVRLESLQGHKTASDNIRRILSDVRL